MPNISEERDALLHKTWTLMLRILVIFAVPAFIAYFVGKKIDAHFSIKQTGTMWMLLVSFIVSWIIMIYEYKKISHAFKILDQKEAQEEQAKNSNDKR